MARLKVFVSSTFYDLKYIRANLEGFIKSFGYEPVLFENGDIGFHPDLPLDESCYREIENSHIQILVIGGNYGSKATKDKVKLPNDDATFDSITKREYLSAIALNIPVYFFVEQGVLSEYSTYRLNKNNKQIKYAHVKDPNIFVLIELIYSRGQGNFIHSFSTFDDIADGLKNQWSHLFTDLLKNFRTGQELNALNVSLQKLNSVTENLQTYSEAILKSVAKEDYPDVINEVNTKIDKDFKTIFFTDNTITEVARLMGLDLENVLEMFNSTRHFDNFLSGLIRIGKGDKTYFGEVFRHRIRKSFETLKNIQMKQPD